MASILVIEDERNVRTTIAQSLSMDGHGVLEASCLKDAQELVRQNEFDVVITDVNLVGESGIEFVKRLRDEGYDGVVIVITAFGTIDNAVEAMKIGADEYLQKPVSLEELGVTVNRTLETRRMKSRLRLYQRMEQVRTEQQEMIGSSDAWRRTVALAERFAAVPIPRGSEPHELPTILILGETGSGKGLLAQHIHRSDPASRGSDPAPFVHVNCAALPLSLIEGELFGHEKGAFTDAKAARAGLFEMAEGGTIFLDEIGEMSPEMQAKLLLVIESGMYRRLGGTRERNVRARIIAATNQDLDERVHNGRFRRDLLYRLNAFTVRVPALSERGEDVVLLAQRLAERLGRQHAKPGLAFSPEAIDTLRAHHWPGNVRELLNAVRRATIVCEGGTIGPEDLGLATGAAFAPHASMIGSARGGHPAAGEPSSVDDGESGRLVLDLRAGNLTIDEIERRLIIAALRHTRGNVSLAARLIGLNRGALRYRIERHGLDSHAEEFARA